MLRVVVAFCAGLLVAVCVPYWDDVRRVAMQCIAGFNGPAFLPVFHLTDASGRFKTVPVDFLAMTVLAIVGICAILIIRRVLATRSVQFPKLQPQGSNPATGPARMEAIAAALSPPTPELPSSNREFLPAALEILETPPSPVALAVGSFICIAFAAALAWSYFGWLDIHAVAPGKIQPSGRSKVVQPLEPGKVVAVLVENGSRVKQGDVLLDLDSTETFAERDAQAHELEAANAEAARRKVAIRLARQNVFEPEPIPFVDGTNDLIRLREESVLTADLAQLASNRASLEAQLTEKLATKERLTLSIDARKKLIDLGKERAGMRQTLDDKGSGSRAMVIEALQQLETQVTADAGDRGQLLETEAAVESLERKIEEAITQFAADQTQKLADAERKRDRSIQELVKAQSKNDRTRLTAPIDGTVQQLTVTTLGQVVSSGQSLMTIVPLEGPIEVEVMVANQDIGFVKPGQSAVVKVESFSFTRYGTIDGTVTKVSRDAVDDREASNLSDATTTAKQQGPQANASSRTQNLVFPATITLARRTINIDGELVSLSPGMAVTVEVRTGRRRAIDYVLAPLREVTSGSAHER